MAGKNDSNELHLTRVYDAPLKAVWQAWTDPKQAAHWWGPRGFTITTHSKDLRVGGHWHYTMHGPDGTNYPNKTVYFEVENEHKLVYDHGANDHQPPMFRVMVVFEAMADGKTMMDMTMTFPSPEIARESKNFIKLAGGNATWDRLAEYVEKEKTGTEIFVINRSFEAPIESVYEMFTNPEHVSQWMPPTGMTMEFLTADIRPGGRSFYVMRGNGFEMYGRCEYLKTERPSRVIYTQEFADKSGKLSRHPAMPTWPATMLTSIQLAAESAGDSADGTRVTITWQSMGKATSEELKAFVSMRAGMTQGWTGSFDKLEEYLAR